MVNGQCEMLNAKCLSLVLKLGVCYYQEVNAKTKIQY